MAAPVRGVVACTVPRASVWLLQAVRRRSPYFVLALALQALVVPLVVSHSLELASNGLKRVETCSRLMH